MWIVIRLHQLNCVLMWAILTGVKNAIGPKLTGDQLMDLEMSIMSSWIQFQDPSIIPAPILQRITRNYIAWGGFILAIVLSGILMKARTA